MRTTAYYLIIWALEDLLKKFSDFDAKMNKALCNRNREEYIRIIREKAIILIETSNYVSQITVGEGKREKKLQEIVCYWSYSAHKFFLSSKTSDIDEILTQRGKQQIKFYTKLE